MPSASCLARLDKPLKGGFQVIYKHRIRSFDGFGSPNDDKIVTLTGMERRNLIHRGA